jgi:hypothetical protein
MLDTRINANRLLDHEGYPFKSKFQLLDTLFDDFAEKHKITVHRKTAKSDSYQKTCIDPAVTEYLLGQVRKYCRLDVVGKKHVIAEVYLDKLAA